MADVMRSDTLNAVSLKIGAVSFKTMGVSEVKIEKIDSVDFFKSRQIAFSSLQPAVQLNNLIIYKTKENPVKA